MAISIDDLPRDTNGIVQGAWCLLHESPTFHGEIGAYTMRLGASTEPACGRPLQRAIAAYGPELYMESWGDLPAGFTLPEMVAHPVPKGIPHRLQPHPRRAAPVATLADTLPPPPPEEPAEAAAPVEDVGSDEPDPLTVMSRDDLEALATALDIEVDGRWGDKRLRKAIRAAQA